MRSNTEWIEKMDYEISYNETSKFPLELMWRIIDGNARGLADIVVQAEDESENYSIKICDREQPELDVLYPAHLNQRAICKIFEMAKNYTGLIREDKQSGGQIQMVIRGLMCDLEDNLEIFMMEKAFTECCEQHLYLEQLCSLAQSIKDRFVIELLVQKRRLQLHPKLVPMVLWFLCELSTWKIINRLFGDPRVEMR